MGHRDKNFLQALARAACEELRRRQLGNAFRGAAKIRVLRNGCDGWAATLGTFVGYQCSAQIWIDKFTGHRARRVYYALAASKKDTLSQLVKKARRELGEHLSICRNHWHQGSGYIRLAEKLAKEKFGRPVYEQYPQTNEYFYGIYEFDRTGLQRNVSHRFVDRAVDFFQTIAQSVSADALQRDYDTYSAVENRPSVARHLRRERNSHVATLRKQCDDYICQICTFDFSKVYGSLGDDFAEAHHIVPLRRNADLRGTTVEDLITVCSNCHRMLHRMSGTPDDVRKLKRIIKKRRRRGGAKR